MKLLELSRNDRTDYLHKNKDLLIMQKKGAIKHADCVSNVSKLFSKDNEEKELTTQQVLETDKIKVKAVINTTNIIDSHMDLHLPGLWTKSLKENKLIYHLDNHKRDFDGIISDNVKASAQTYSFKDLGFDYSGNTQALVFVSEIEKDRNSKMFQNYAKGYVKNHSVGMMYVKLALALDNKNYKDEFEVWNENITKAVNPEVAEEYGYFWVVSEAKVLEGSAVLFGSNFVTPTIEMEAVKEDTSTVEPSNGTQDVIQYLASNFKL